MKASWEKIEKNQGVLDVEVDAEQVASALDKAFKKVVDRVNVPGFRKGKVPRKIFERRFGIESLYQDAINIILPEAYTEAVKETGIEPVDRPEVDIDQFAQGEPFKFKAKVIVKPEVKLGEYKGLQVPQADNGVSDEEIADELKRLQERHAELVVLEDGKAEKGDIAVIDFEGFLNGEAFEGGKGENYSLELGSNSFIPGFEDQVIGMVKGEEKDIQVTFPEDYHAENLKGQEVVFKVKVHDIKRKNLPELDDEFAKDVSEFETLDEYKEDIRQRLQESKEKSNEQARDNAVVEQAVGNAEVDVPEVMMETETTQMLQEFANRLRMQGMTMEMYYQFSGQDESKLREQMKEDAAKRVRTNLVLEAIAKAEDIKASDEDLNEELENLSKSYNRPAEELKMLLAANGRLDDLMFDLAARKTVKFLVEQSVSAPAAEEKKPKPKAKAKTKKAEQEEA